MERAESIDELKSRLAVQSRVADVLAAAPSLREATPKFLEIVCEGLGWDWGAFWEVDRSAHALRVVEVWHRPGIDTRDFEAITRRSMPSPGHGFPGEVWASKQPGWVHGGMRLREYARTAAARKAGFETGVSFPICLEGDVLGVMELISRARRLRDEDTIRFLTTLGSQIGQFIGRKRAEEALRRSEEGLADAQRIARIGSWDWRPQSGDLTWSDEVYRLFGFSPREFAPTYERFLAIVYPDDRREVDSAVKAAIEGLRAYRIDHRFLRADGELRYAHSEGSVNFDSEGTPIRMVGTIQDVTERNRAEAERERFLVRQQALARIAQNVVQNLTLSRVVDAVIEQTSDVLEADVVGLWLADPARRELSLQAFRGRSPATADLIRHLTYASPSLTARAAATGQLQLRQKPQIESDDLPITRETSRAEAIETLLAIPLHSRGVLVGVVAFAWRAARELSRADLEFYETVANLFAVVIGNASLYEQVRETLRLREEFMAGVAHALRTPVTVIKGSSQFAMKVDAHEEIARQTLQKVVRQTDRISTIIDDLLNVMRLRQHDLVLRRECLDLAALARDCIDELNRTTEPHRIRFSGDGPLVVEADRGLIGRVLARIVENALLYSPEGAAVDVETKREGSNGVISVTDHGPGIPFERQHHVFEPFYESVPAGAPGYVGIVSLGLYLSKQLLDALGGRIWLRSAPGRGTTFSFSLPLAGTRNSE